MTKRKQPHIFSGIVVKVDTLGLIKSFKDGFLPPENLHKSTFTIAIQGDLFTADISFSDYNERCRGVNITFDALEAAEKAKTPIVIDSGRVNIDGFFIYYNIKATRGGKREGSGRKIKEETVITSVRLNKEALEILRAAKYPINKEINELVKKISEEIKNRNSE